MSTGNQVMTEGNQVGNISPRHACGAPPSPPASRHLSRAQAAAGGSSLLLLLHLHHDRSAGHHHDAAPRRPHAALPQLPPCRCHHLPHLAAQHLQCKNRAWHRYAQIQIPASLSLTPLIPIFMFAVARTASPHAAHTPTHSIAIAKTLSSPGALS